MKNHVFKITLGFLIFFRSIMALSDCGPGDFSVAAIVPSVVNFSNSSSVNTSYTLNLMGFTETDTSECFFYAYFNYGFYGGGYTNRRLKHESSNNFLTFNVYSDSSYTTNSIVRLDSEANSNSHVLFDPPYFSFSTSAQSLTKVFFAQLDNVPEGHPAGLYTELLTMHVSSNRTLSGLYSWPLAVTRPIQFIYRIEKKLDVSIVANGGVFDPLATAKVMNFGDLVAQETQAADILVNSNVGYRLSFSSQNEGRLKHSEFSVFVPYTLSVSGAQVTLVGSNSNPVVVSSSPGMSPPGGFVVPLNIQIGNLSGGETGGIYTDVVQLNIEAF